ncbi:hypothetical protein K504DRAFT_528792 [Pleomassaria siparia CBS 279.74]|uniref:RING-type E3 ubiquitin transferase n=1 Tax=Pleomassaria siparia CBS 279.74 TaxID=1314801 RepID=A0A6G1KNP4_9PLEO|nr:hypothetical protein K504DRAFT_528792 [Pleomassaria siparia CBS 279.74]
MDELLMEREPQHDVHPESDSSSAPYPDKEDADTCRICRGEGTTDEPLFFPCKCSGSIKYVHQECLMEWLSHSQKKYCELCKTSFRFTKLYHPGMPSRIPNVVFLRRAAVHVAKMFMTWCRAVLVAFVWIILLPYSMRVVWRSLFWVGDGGWSREHADAAEKAQEDPPTAPWDLELLQSAVGSAIESAKAANTSVSLPPGYSLPLSSMLMPFSHTLNMSAGEPTIWTMLKRVFITFTYPLSEHTIAPGSNTTHRNTTTPALDLGTDNPSLLSNTSYLKWFPSPTANRFLVDVAEGQLITLSVVVAFILIFLIREWVVQQQPVINMVALGDDPLGDDPLGDDPLGDDPLGDDPGHDRDLELDEPELEDEDDDAEEHEEDREEDIHGERAYHNASFADDDAVEDTVDTEAHPQPRVRRTSSAQKNSQASFKAWQNDYGLSEELRTALDAGSNQDIANALKNIPVDAALELKRLLSLPEDPSSTAEQEREQGNSDTNVQIEEAAPQASGSSASIPRGRSNSPSGSSDVTRNTGRLESPNSRQRPNMPSRGRSNIATEIRRSLEEGNSWSFANAPQVPEEMTLQHDSNNIPDSWEDRTAEKDHEAAVSDQELNSEHSSESWQQIPDSMLEGIADQTEEVTSSKDKGKARVVNESPDRSLGDGTWIPPPRPEDESLTPATDGNTRDDIAGSNLSVVDSDSSYQGSGTNEFRHLDDLEMEPERELLHPQLPRPQARLIDAVLDWLFGDIAPGVQAAEDDLNDEHIVQDLADEAPFVPFAGNEPQEAANRPIQDPEVAAAAAQAGIDVNDQDAIDDAEDLEGILELIGMQGPLTGLFQNAMFSAVLISATLACAVWFPYLCGKIVLLLGGNPVSIIIKFPLRLVAALTDLVVDGALILGAGVVFWGAQSLSIVVKLCTWGTLSKFMEGPLAVIAGPARSVADSAMDRIAKLTANSSFVPHYDDFRLSINSHVALRTIQNTTSYALNQTGNAIAMLYEDATADPPSETFFRIVRHVPVAVQQFFASFVKESAAMASWIWNSKPYQITLDLTLSQNVTDAYTAVEQWTATDRVITVFAGYAAFAVVGAIYLKRGRPFSASQQGRKVEAVITEILQQAGGVLKVILIISIEMLAFPLYCGLLLDLALLPLFHNAGLYTRWQFTRESPWTSCFVHWFIGTCYMFHFALFVSMCRKIMRKGVLYFIRDPDDPTFHPVRDVLERSVTTQLRKIAFSGLVYGGLVIICLGGVVWSLNSVTSGVLPIHWSSQTPSLEFPLDLLFYNFLTPVIIKLYKPSDALHAICEVWFKACARFLRLSHFLFGERVKEEEGRHIRRTWASWFYREVGDSEKPVIGEDRKILAEDRGTRVYFMFDGKYVRAPASDSFRVPKAQPVFIEVDQHDVRNDGQPEPEDGAQHVNTTVVYIPPWFRIRIALFVLTIWVFAAATGMGVTIIPLLFGRYLFSILLPPTVEMNDIHALSLGIYSLGILGYGVYQAYKFLSSFNQPVPSPLSTLYNVAATASKIGLRILRFAYVWTSLVFIIPFLFTVVIELFFLMPLHAYLGPDEPHVVHIIQDWTLGFLYARLAARLVFSNRASRAARAFSAVIADGYLNPNARVVTRCILIPVVAIFSVVIAFPTIFAFVLNQTIWAGASEVTKRQVSRFSFPLLGVGLVAIWAGREGLCMLNKWRMVVRDEVYLIGERLHNFGEKKAPPVASSASIKA